MVQKCPAAVVLALAAAILAPRPAGAADLVAITDRGEFLQFTAGDPRETMRRDLQGAGLPLVGIDVRPADGRLYGVDRAGGIYRIDWATAVATFTARLSVPLAPAASYVVDFDPVADRLHIVGADGQNLRADVATGAAAAGGTIRAAEGGPPPRIVAGAYASPAPGAAAAPFFVIDAANGIYARLDAGDDGRIRPVSQSPGYRVDGADIGSDGTRDQGYAVMNNILHVFDVATGASSAVQAIGTGATGRTGRIIDIAVLPPRR